MTTSESNIIVAGGPPTSETAAAQPFRWGVALIGAFVALLGISGLIDDSGLVEHPWWAVILVAAIAGCVLGVLSSLRSLATPRRG